MIPRITTNCNRFDSATAEALGAYILAFAGRETNDAILETLEYPASTDGTKIYMWNYGGEIYRVKHSPNDERIAFDHICSRVAFSV